MALIVSKRLLFILESYESQLMCNFPTGTRHMVEEEIASCRQLPSAGFTPPLPLLPEPPAFLCCLNSPLLISKEVKGRQGRELLLRCRLQLWVSFDLLCAVVCVGQAGKVWRMLEMWESNCSSISGSDTGNNIPMFNKVGKTHCRKTSVCPHPVPQMTHRSGAK